MKKDKKWLKEKAGRLFFDNSISNYSYLVVKREVITEISNLIDQLDEPEKPVIPQFVADFIRATKPNNSLRLAFEYIAQRKIDNYDDELALWIEEGNSELFASAWLDGYEMEKEKQYYIRENNYLLCKYKDEVIDYLNAVERGVTDLVELKLTENEIKDYDKRYWAFAEEVTE